MNNNKFNETENHKQKNPVKTNLKILIVDDYTVVRAALRLQLYNEPGCEVVGEAKNGAEALSQAHLLRPDIILMDVDMPVMNGLVATAKLTKLYPCLQIIMLTIYDDLETQNKALAAGAVAFVAKSNVEDLLKVMRQLASPK